MAQFQVNENGYCEQLIETYQRNPGRFLDALDVVLDRSKQPRCGQRITAQQEADTVVPHRIRGQSSMTKTRTRKLLLVGAVTADTARAAT